MRLTPPASRAGTRSVATLTDAQLARKRANDREAQRSIRQRTKDRIEGLEQRIRELTEEQNDGRSLEDVERRNSELEEELWRLRESLPNTESMMIPNFPPPMCKCSFCYPKEQFHKEEVALNLIFATRTNTSSSASHIASEYTG